ncbi:hypothetical protein GALMADRAFT_1295800 [Galerina marginata CBS 339.88]|uniref:MYND-type domain-containing protein n=1 Tax=Galerina marginata (strain CBS 339.88) TaxID=685588 RepID=A0A067TDM9_GALM3|nr:hypothetical protein GALMADRAFT_1295800 [Galerina marginata CBS 339.88]
MEKRSGAEAIFGLGGGTVPEGSQKNLEKAEDLCKKRKPKKAIPYLVEAILESPDNLDAAIQCAYLSDQEGDRAEAIEMLELAERTGQRTLKKTLGEDCFEAKGRHVGRFWLVMETRPYMRVLQALVRIYFEEGRYEESEKLMIEMLRLCPRDNTSQRAWLGSMLIRNGHYANALYFIQAWIEHESPPGGGIAFKAPSRSLLSASQAREQSRFAIANMMHDAALASFRLFGDCPQSRQFLKIAAYVQPIIFTKILTRASRPEKLDMHPRPDNGPEDAHDYLWLTQDLWMEPDVWQWVNQSQDVKNGILQFCDKCYKRETTVAEFKRCSACRVVRYCTPQCQKKDWSTHKPDCKAFLEQKVQHRQLYPVKSFMGKNSTFTTMLHPCKLALRQFQRPGCP